MAAYSRNTKLLAHGTHTDSQFSDIFGYDEIDTQLLDESILSFLLETCSVAVLYPILKAY
jgi:hypothetical protein